MRRTPGLLDYTLYSSRLLDGSWSEPVVLPFSGRYRDAGPAFSADGEALVFDSARPAEGFASGSINLWQVERQAEGWGEPRLLVEPSRDGEKEPETGADEFGPLLAADGTLWFYSFRQPLRGGSHYRYTRAGGVQRDSSMPDPSASTFVGYLALSAAGTIAVIEGRARSGSGTDLYITCRTEAGWADARPLASANSAAGDGTPSLSSDGKWLLFASERNTGLSEVGTSNIFLVDTQAQPLPCPPS